MNNTNKDYKAIFFLCDREWKMEHVFESDFGDDLKEGQFFCDQIKEPEKLTEAVTGEKTVFSLPVSLLKWEGELTALFCRIREHFLVFLGRIENSAAFSSVVRSYVDYYFWSQEYLKEPYDDGYMQIQQMNNQLINSQRALMKSNRQLKDLLDQIREANSTIALLERDDLTNLYNASAFYKKAEKLMEEHPDTDWEVIILDIDHFKLVNELFGREAGDTLIKGMAMMMQGLEHAEEGIFARIFADTFYALMPRNLQFHSLLSQRACAFLESYPLPINLHEKVGVYFIEDKDLSIEKMCDRARLAMERLKQQSDSHIAFYDRKFHENMILEQKILDRIQGALKNHEFLVYFQPKVTLPEGKIVGAEALIRWNSPELGWVWPNQFIPILEKNGYIYDVDRYIWEESCRQISAWKRDGLKEFSVSVNVARGDLYQKDLIPFLKGLIQKYELDMKDLHLEIIERNYVEDATVISRVLTELREEGFLIEMDDFGTGESSLAMVASMPVDYLKLDRQFITADITDLRHREVIRLIINMAKALHIKVISEGIETKEQAKLLYDLGCDLAQGYYFGKPVPVEEFFREMNKEI